MFSNVLLSLLFTAGLTYAGTATTSAPVHCTTHAGKHLHCGAYGSVRHPSVYKTLTLPKLNNCRDACEASRPSCHTLAYTASTKQCVLYNKPLTKMGLKKSSSSPTQVFNIHCFHCKKPVYNTVYSTGGTVGATSTIVKASGKKPGTVQVTFPTPASCNNAGLQYAIQSNPYSRGLASADPTYSSFRAQAFQTETPSITGQTTYVDVPYVGPGQQGYIYGHTETDMTYLAVNHRGYLFAPETGTYVFNYTLSDDVGLLWTKANAYNGYTTGNADVFQIYDGSRSSTLQTPVSFSVNLNQGDYLPIRILWANAGYAARFFLQITGPDQIGVINYGSQLDSPFLAQFSCDGTSAPAFGAWGNEGK